MSSLRAGARDRLLAGGTDRLVDLLLDDLLDRPIIELVDPAWLAQQLAATARQAAADPQVEEFFRARVRDARSRVPAGRPPLPDSLKKPLAEVIGRPYVPDRELVGRLLDHNTARLLLRNLFQDLLIAFARKLKPPMAAPKLPGGLPFGGLKGLQRLGEGLQNLVGEEFEAQVEHRAREFMDAGVQRLVDKMADHLCDPALVAEYGEWRMHGLEVLLATDMRKLAVEVEKLDPDALVATGAALVRGIAGQESLVGQLEAVLRTAMESTREHTTDAAGNVQAGPGKSARELLGGLEAHGIELVRGVMRERARALVDTPAFATWWDEVVEGS